MAWWDKVFGKRSKGTEKPVDPSVAAINTSSGAEVPQNDVRTKAEKAAAALGHDPKSPEIQELVELAVQFSRDNPGVKETPRGRDDVMLCGKTFCLRYLTREEQEKKAERIAAKPPAPAPDRKNTTSVAVADLSLDDPALAETLMKPPAVKDPIPEHGKTVVRPAAQGPGETVVRKPPAVDVLGQTVVGAKPDAQENPDPEATVAGTKPPIVDLGATNMGDVSELTKRAIREAEKEKGKQ